MQQNLDRITKFAVKDNPPLRDPSILNHSFGSRNFPALVC